METVAVLINGRREQRIEVFDRGFQYGDGLFETLLIDDRQILFWNEHIERLEAGCRRLGIPAPDGSLLYREALELCFGADESVLKIILTRGPGGRGYLSPAPVRPTRVLSLHPLPAQIEKRRQEGVRVCLCRTPLGINPCLAGVKHCNRLEQILARSEWSDPEIYEGLMCDSEGWLVEGTMTNLFWVKEGHLLTPRVDRCGVAGIVRAWVLRTMHAWRIATSEVRMRPSELREAGEVFLTNSVIGIVPVIGCPSLDCTWPVGDLTRRLQGEWK